METFLAHAKTVLRHDGYLIYADFRNKNDVPSLQRRKRIEDLRRVSEWHDDLSALHSAEMIGSRNSSHHSIQLRNPMLVASHQHQHLVTNVGQQKLTNLSCLTRLIGTWLAQLLTVWPSNCDQLHHSGHSHRPQEVSYSIAEKKKLTDPNVPVNRVYSSLPVSC
jgi:hypothetical protein